MNSENVQVRRRHCNDCLRMLNELTENESYSNQKVGFKNRPRMALHGSGRESSVIHSKSYVENM